MGGGRGSRSGRRLRKRLRGAGSVLDAGRFGGLRWGDGGVARQRLRSGAGSVLNPGLRLYLLLVLDVLLGERVVLDGGCVRSGLLRGEDLGVASALGGGRSNLGGGALLILRRLLLLSETPATHGRPVPRARLSGG